jgi:BASS family bile acid:Na+ symporter
MAVLDWRALLTVVALVLVGLVFGHLLGGPGRAERAALALTAPSRHIGFALAVGLAVAPNAAPAVTGTILFYFIVRTVMILPYQLQMSRAPSTTVAGAGSAQHPADRS